MGEIKMCVWDDVKEIFNKDWEVILDEMTEYFGREENEKN